MAAVGKLDPAHARPGGIAKLAAELDRHRAVLGPMQHPHRRVDGAEQYFTRAIDFGYSKTAQESLGVWGKESVLGDLVWVIRRFRPDVIITRFAAEGAGGHGHHTAQGMLIKEAFSAAADPARYPEQLAFAPAWKATRILLNRGRQRPDESAPPLRVETGAYNALLGKSYSEIAGESRSQHKSQGFGSGGRRGAQYDYFELWEGSPASAGSRPERRGKAGSRS